MPGILTLAIAPILFMFKTNKYIADRSEHCISVVYCDNDEFIKKDFLPERVYQIFKLSGEEKHDSLNLILIENLSRGLRLSQNDSIGLKVILNKGIKYGTYLSLMNCCLKSGINSWIPFGDSVFIYNKNCPKDYNHDLGQNILMPDFLYMGSDCFVDNPKPKLTLIQRIKNEKFMIKLASPFVIIYLILLYLTINKIKNEG